MIQVIFGSIFDLKCDLLIVPCNSDGGVTRSIYTNLIDRGIPLNVRLLSHGKVFFKEVQSEFAGIVGYAASVDNKTSTSTFDAIVNIASQIVRYSKENQIGKVNVPLLGSGAGGMGYIESFEALRTSFESEDEVTFNIFCYSREIYKNITSTLRETDEKNVLRHPRTFISYAGNDKQHAQWVKKLAGELRNNGVDARLDVFHLKPGFDLPQWMTNEVIMADKVLLICDKHYVEKADIRKGGVGWETMIIQGDMLSQGDNNNKFIAIVLEDDVEKSLPIYMKSKYALHWGSRSEISSDLLKELILCIFECEIEPPIGQIPDYVARIL